MDNIVLPKLSYKIMGALFKVHNELGPSLLEKHYQRGIELEFKKQEIKFKREYAVSLFYDNEKIGKYLLDFVIEGLVILEIKAQKQYSPKFFQQTLSYLKQAQLPLGIIANFRTTQLRYKRVINPDFKEVDLSEEDERFDK